MAKNTKSRYPNITPFLQILGTIWALGIITYLLSQNREVPMLLWLVAASAALGPVFLPVLNALYGRGKDSNDNSTNNSDDDES